MRLAPFTVLVAWSLALLPTPSGVTRADEAPGSQVSVGVARVDITPEGPIRMRGYAARQGESEGVVQKLWAKALAIGDDDPAVLLAVDNCGVSAAITEEIAERLHRKAGLKRERFALCSSHTHSGPFLANLGTRLRINPFPPDQQERIDRYTETFIDRLEQVVLDALADRRPGRLAWAQGEVGFAANRRVLDENGRWTGFGVNPDGPVDHSLPLLSVTDTEGNLRAVVVNYACHCTTLGSEFNEVCGDWAGYAQEAIERDHPEATALVVIGCGGDANPEPRGTLQNAQDHGEAIAREVNRLLDGDLAPLPTTITARLKWIELPFGPLPTREEWAERAEESGYIGRHARHFLDRLERGEPPPDSVLYPIQTWCFGDALAIVFLGGEVVVDYALRLKRELDASKLWVSAYSNDVPCYIPSKRILDEGGYEADYSMIYYGHPTRLAPETEDLIVRTVHDLLPASFASRGHADEARAGPDDSARVGSLRVVVLSTMLTDFQGLGEWGFAALVEADGHRLLFDTGARPETVLNNARELDIDLSDITDVVLSHHHGDHTGGLLTLRHELMKENPEAMSRVYVGPGIFLPRFSDDGRQINEMLDLKPSYEATGGTFVEVSEPLELIPGAWLTGPVPRTHPERNWSGRTRIETADGLVEDTLPEDIALVLDTDQGLVVISGCGHAGIVNTLEYARSFAREAPIHAALGGFHLFTADDATLDWTADRLREVGLAHFLGAHCTGIEATYRLRDRLGLDRASCVVGAVGAGFDLDQGLIPGVIAR